VSKAGNASGGGRATASVQPARRAPARSNQVHERDTVRPLPVCSRAPFAGISAGFKRALAHTALARGHAGMPRPSSLRRTPSSDTTMHTHVRLQLRTQLLPICQSSAVATSDESGYAHVHSFLQYVAGLLSATSTPPPVLRTCRNEPDLAHSGARCTPAWPRCGRHHRPCWTRCPSPPAGRPSC
jgi:hypothetical protein